VRYFLYVKTSIDCSAAKSLYPLAMRTRRYAAGKEGVGSVVVWMLPSVSGSAAGAEDERDRQRDRSSDGRHNFWAH
jgi:hypothetical protein